MSNPLSALLADQGFVLLDGAQGTELERRGVYFGASKLWSAQLLIDNPDLLREVHLDYLRAGSDVITTFTYQASIQGFAQDGVAGPRAAQLLNLAVDLAEAARAQYLAESLRDSGGGDCGKHVDRDSGFGGRGSGGGGGADKGSEAEENKQQQPEDVVGSSCSSSSGRRSGRGGRRRPLVAYSCGSYGGYLADGSEFRGDYADSVSYQDLADFHRARIEPVRHRPEIDLLAFETIPCLKEAEAIVRLLREERYGKPAWISFSCKDAVHTCHGERFAEECMPLLAAAAAEGLLAAAGVNCTAPRHVAPLLTAARRRLASLQPSSPPPSGGLQPPQPSPAPLLLLCYPNSGEDWDGEHRCWRHLADDLAAPSRFAAAGAGWVRGETRVALLGGCCRTGAEHIRALRCALLERKEEEEVKEGGLHGC
ncbi:hypothetical protein Agub_g11092 [Astrephomene gubernaculifera]|uniref:Hcy-binding domain-containing protein n=1 Tax=Astrephomene gubernaculifera TaxID=47775 RepID=A0AAD3E0D2_9CHLO|nr:hypothetical protein Agub_g11092 [Astrephomene gubernaculifera]